MRNVIKMNLVAILRCIMPNKKLVCRALVFLFVAVALAAKSL